MLFIRIEVREGTANNVAHDIVPPTPAPTFVLHVPTGELQTTGLILATHTRFCIT